MRRRDFLLSSVSVLALFPEDVSARFAGHGGGSRSGGSPVSPQIWDPTHKNAAAALSNGNLTATSTASGIDIPGFGAIGVRSGKYYWETTLRFAGGTGTGSGSGIGTILTETADYLGFTTDALSYYHDGTLYNDGNVLATYATFASGVVVCHALDLDNFRYWVRPGITANWNNNSANNPATNTGGLAIPSALFGNPPVVPAYDLGGNTLPDSVVAAFSVASWAGVAPAGFGAFFPQPPMRAFDFYSKFGVNGNLDSGGTPSQELTDMAYVGINNIRGGTYNSVSQPADAWFAYVATLTAAGVRQHFHLNDGGGFLAMSTWIAALKTHIVTPYGANMVMGVSGPNEADIQPFNYNSLTGIAAANAAQADLYTGMKADPALSSIPVDMWPVSVLTMPSAIGDQSAHCDRANMHDYYQVDNSGGVGVAVGGGPIPSAIDHYLSFYDQEANKTHFVTTESGYGSTVYAGGNESASEYAQARLILMNLFDHARRPDCDEVYYFTLRWGSPGGAGNWGLINDDGTPKPSGTAVHYLMQILTDSGGAAATFTPALFSYTLSGMPALGRNFLLAKSDGSYLILLYQETPIWTVSTATAIALSDSAVTVTLPRAMSGYVYNPIVNGVTPVQTITNQSSVGVTLNDAPLIIDVI